MAPGPSPAPTPSPTHCSADFTVYQNATCPNATKVLWSLLLCLCLFWLLLLLLLFTNRVCSLLSVCHSKCLYATKLNHWPAPFASNNIPRNIPPITGQQAHNGGKRRRLLREMWRSSWLRHMDLFLTQRQLLVDVSMYPGGEWWQCWPYHRGEASAGTLASFARATPPPKSEAWDAEEYSGMGGWMNDWMF